MNGKIICSVAAFSIVWGFAANPEVTPVLPMVQNSCYQVSTVEELYGFASAINGSNGFNPLDSAYAYQQWDDHSGKWTYDLGAGCDSDE